MFPKLCHSLLQGVPQSDLRPPPEKEPGSNAVDVPMPGSIDANALDSWVDIPESTPCLRQPLSHPENQSLHVLHVLHPASCDPGPNLSLDVDAPTKRDSTVGSSYER